MYPVPALPACQEQMTHHHSLRDGLLRHAAGAGLIVDQLSYRGTVGARPDVREVGGTRPISAIPRAVQGLLLFLIPYLPTVQ